MKIYMTDRHAYQRYSDLVKNYGFDRADTIIETECANWDQLKEEVWQKYDFEVLSKEN
jgi:hypothetical protein